MRYAPLVALALCTSTASAQGESGTVMVTLAEPASGPAEIIVTLRNEFGQPTLTLREDLSPGAQTARIALPPVPRATHSVQAGLARDGRIAAQGPFQMIEDRIGLDFETELHPELAIGFSDRWQCDTGRDMSIIRSAGSLLVASDNVTAEFMREETRYLSSGGDVLTFADNRAFLSENDAPQTICAPALFRPLLPLSAAARDGSWRIALDRGIANIELPGFEDAELAATGLEISARRDGVVRLHSDQLTLELTENQCRSLVTGLKFPFTARLDATASDAANDGCAGDPLTLLSTSAWQVTSLLGLPIELATASDLTIKIVDGEISGRGPCNRYVGTAITDASGLALRELGTTRLACPANLRNIEQRFLDALEATTSFDIGPSGMLTLIAGQTPVLTAVRRPAP